MKSALLPAKPFTVVLRDRRFKFTPEDKGYSVRCLDRRGVITQGDTFEEAAANALDALDMVESCEADPWPDSVPAPVRRARAVAVSSPRP